MLSAYLIDSRPNSKTSTHSQHNAKGWKTCICRWCLSAKRWKDCSMLSEQLGCLLSMWVSISARYFSKMTCDAMVSDLIIMAKATLYIQHHTYTKTIWYYKRGSQYYTWAMSIQVKGENVHIDVNIFSFDKITSRRMWPQLYTPLILLMCHTTSQLTMDLVRQHSTECINARKTRNSRGRSSKFHRVSSDVLQLLWSLAFVFS